MGDKLCDKEVKALSLEFRTFEKRNIQRFHILHDLSLANDACKTPEVRLSISEMTRRYFAELQMEEQTLNKRIQKIVQDAARKNDKKDKKEKDAVIKALEAAALAAATKTITAKLNSKSKLKFKYKGLKKPPFVTFEMKF